MSNHLERSKSTTTSPQRAVELREVFSILHTVQKKWWNIGLQLHVSNDTLHVIKNDPKLKTMEEQLREMLDGRIKQGDLTWDEVVEALEDNTVKEKELAKTIRNKYINPQPSMNGSGLSESTISESGSFKATGDEAAGLLKKSGTLLGKRKNESETKMPKKRQKTDQLDQPPHFDESVFVKQPVPIKYRCIHCGKIPTKAFQLQCCDAGKEKEVSCRNCKPACASCGKDDYKTESKVSYNIRKLKQYCPNKANGCQETITELEKDKHVENCQYKKYSCKYEELGCKEKLLKEEKETHEKDREIHFDMAMEAILALKKQSATDATCILALQKEVKSLQAVVPVTPVIPAKWALE